MPDDFDLAEILKCHDMMSKITQWALLSPGEFTTYDVDRDLGYNDSFQRYARTIALERLVDMDIIERTGSRRGHYRLPDRRLKTMDLYIADAEIILIMFAVNKSF